MPLCGGPAGAELVVTRLLEVVATPNEVAPNEVANSQAVVDDVEAASQAVVADDDVMLDDVVDLAHVVASSASSCLQHRQDHWHRLSLRSVRFPSPAPLLHPSF